MHFDDITSCNSGNTTIGLPFASNLSLNDGYPMIVVATVRFNGLVTSSSALVCIVILVVSLSSLACFRPKSVREGSGTRACKSDAELKLE